MNVALLGKRVFAYVIKDLKIRSSWIIRLALNPVTGVLTGDTERREGPVKMEAESRVMQR